MNSKKFFFVMIGIIVLTASLTIGGIVLGGSMLKKKSAELVELKLQDQLIEAQETALNQAKKDVEKYQELNEIARAIVPQDKDQARTIREIIALAGQSRIQISSIDFPTSTLGNKRPVATAPATSATEGAAAAPVVQPPPSQLTPVKSINGVYEMEISLGISNKNSTYLQLIGFLERLEQNRRTAQITNLTIQPNNTNRNLLNFNLTMKVFVKP